MAHQIHSYSEVPIHLIFFSQNDCHFIGGGGTGPAAAAAAAAAAASCCTPSCGGRKNKEGSNNARERFVCLAGCQIVVEWLPVNPFLSRYRQIEDKKKGSVEVFYFSTRMTSHWAFLQHSIKR